MEDIRTKKASLRASYLSKRRNMDKDRKKELDDSVCQKILESNTFKNGEIVLSYMPKTEEIDIRPVLEEALRQGKRVAFPLCDPTRREMSFHFVDSLDMLKPGHFGLLEPDENYEKYDCSSKQNAICIIPGIVFDKKGYRIGYGGGYYDRYLSKFKGMKLGIVYYDSIINMVPRSKFDFSVDVLISERGIYAKR